MESGSKWQRCELNISSGTDEVRAKREPSLCNESVKRHFCTRISKVGKCAAFQLWTPTYFNVKVSGDFFKGKF